MRQNPFPLKRVLPLLLLAGLIFGIASAAAAHSVSQEAAPETVIVAGTIQSKLGCSGDWMPECAETALIYDADDDLWQASFDLPAGEYEYKAALNGTWDENYGAGAAANGENIKLSLAADARVKFSYSNETHWVADSVNSIVANVPGSFQDEIGCPGDWQPDCLRSWLQDPDGDGVYEFTTDNIPAGSYEAKVALDESWTLNYGADGAKDGANIPFVVDKNGDSTSFKFDTATNLLTIAAGSGKPTTPQPNLVVIPGTLQSENGCSGDWQPDCANTALVYDEEDGIWQGTFNIQPGDDQDQKGSRYKVALDGGWAVNYGINAQAGGADIPLVVAEPTDVKFYFNNETHWVADSFNYPIAVAFGDFQSEMGCNNDNDPGCLRSWLQDPDGDGLYIFATDLIPAGDYVAQVAINETMDEVYGANGEANGTPIAFNVPKNGQEMFFGYDPSSHTLTISSEGAPKGDINKQKAHWVRDDTIAWDVTPPDGATFALYYDPEGGIRLEPGKLSGGQSIPLEYTHSGIEYTLAVKFPYIKDTVPLKVGADNLAKIPEILKSQIVIAMFDANGKLADAAGVQIPGVLDDLFAYSGPLGISFDGDAPTLRVWAPTAQSVTLHLYDDSTTDADQTFPLALDAKTGVWSVAGEASWTGKFYLYEVEVFVPRTGKVEHNLVTDPYSFSLSMNSRRSQIVNLEDPALAPSGWDTVQKPPLTVFEDAVLYELHIRDFSIYDTSVPEAERGTYLAFTEQDSNGMKHLKALAEAGLTHIHLLPAFDIASVNEDKSTWLTVDDALLATYAPNSDQQRLAVGQVIASDGFNWGYDPLHYTTPEGSYATNPDGSTRIVEFRSMVQALNQAGLRVVMDVVYNHTNASGQDANSVLDKVVPGYYHRLNADGRVETSTCCQNTATEHAMMEKLMIDSLVTWAKYYKVDGFRFDLMGHHMKFNMEAVRAALDALTLTKDGVDGSKILIYGEGWDFGEVALNARGENAIQLNLGGTGIATFNDRLRDAARGGGPFNPVQEQGFLTGLFDAPNGYDQGTAEAQLARLLHYEDWIRIGLAGNLEGYKLVNDQGKSVFGVQLDYNGNPAAYTKDPQENIVYISAHDNETLFDAIQYKAADSVTIGERVRMSNLGVSLVLMSQGIPFFHAGDDLLRSKSFDGNTYNSGDWFNRLDFTYQTNNWGVGLPNFRSDATELMSGLLGNPALKPSPEDIQFAAAHFREMLQIRKSSPLFRLQTAEEINQRLAFLNTGAEQIPGVIVMTLDDTVGDDIDPAVTHIVVVFNATDGVVAFTDSTLAGLALELHPIQKSSVDAVVQSASFDSAAGALTVPGRTAAVFVAPQPGYQPPSEAEPTTEPAGEPEATQPVVAPAATETPAEAPATTTSPLLYVGLGAGAVAIGAVLVAMIRRRKK